MDCSKVMAWSQVTATVQYYYQSGSTGTNPNIIPNILNSLAGAIAGGSTAGTLAHGNAANITGQLSGNTGFVTAVEPASNTSGTPQAYLTILFFDERFNFIAAADGGYPRRRSPRPGVLLLRRWVLPILRRQGTAMPSSMSATAAIRMLISIT